MFRLFLRVVPGLLDWTKRVLKDPIRDTAALRAGGGVRVAVVDTDVHTRVDDLLLGLRKAREGAGLLRSVRISRGHLKIQLIGTEESSEHMRNCPTDRGMARRVLGKIGRIDEWLLSRIDFGRGIVVLVAQMDSRDRTPKVVKVLAFPAGDLSIGKRGFSQGIHARRVAYVSQIVL